MFPQPLIKSMIIQLTTRGTKSGQQLLYFFYEHYVQQGQTERTQFF
jgi:hypothetical protein